MRLSPSFTLLLFACSNDVQVSQTANVEPAASITSPSDGDTLTTAEPAELVGTIADGNGLDDVVSVVWDSSIDGILSEPPDSMPDANGTTRASALLSEGTRVEDVQLAPQSVRARRRCMMVWRKCVRRRIF